MTMSKPNRDVEVRKSIRPSATTTALAASSVASENDAIVARIIANVRDDMIENPYLEEARRVLQVAGYRSAIGQIWNAVVDDLRNKIIHRSLGLFSKEVKPSREVKTYEDFQDHISDDQLIDGAFAIGVIGWEARKVLRHCKETRHIFDGHPRSSNPSVYKLVAMLEDCVKYVLAVELPHQIIDIDEYLATLANADFDRNQVAVANALSELPDTYKNQLINRLFTAYVDDHSTSTLRSNIEFIAPTLWKVLPRQVKVQVVRRVDQEYPKGRAAATDRAFRFVQVVGAASYLSASAREYIITPLVEKLSENLDTWKVEDECVRLLKPYAAQVPPGLLYKYVRAITLTYVGTTGYSPQYGRTDFYANGAANEIPDMFKLFDVAAAEAFASLIRKDKVLKSRIRLPGKLARLRSLANIVIERVVDEFDGRELLNDLVEADNEEKFWNSLAHGM